jgi:hypothetical protein
MLGVIMKNVKRKSGTTLVKRSLAVIAALLIGAAGWALYGNLYNKPLATAQNAPTESPVMSTPTESPSTDTTQPISDARSLNVPELGIKILNIPASISDLSYVINVHGKDPQGYTSADFSTGSLTNLDKNCSPTGNVSDDGVLVRIEGAHTYQPFYYLVKQFDGFWIGYEHPQSACSQDQNTEAIHMSQADAFQTLVKDPNNIIALQ